MDHAIKHSFLWRPQVPTHHPPEGQEAKYWPAVFRAARFQLKADINFDTHRASSSSGHGCGMGTKLVFKKLAFTTPTSRNSRKTFSLCCLACFWASANPALYSFASLFTVVTLESYQSPVTCVQQTKLLGSMQTHDEDEK